MVGLREAGGLTFGLPRLQPKGFDSLCDLGPETLTGGAVSEVVEAGMVIPALPTSRGQM